MKLSTFYDRIADIFLSTERIIPQYHRDIPYYSQTESREIVDDVMTSWMQASEDRLWQNSGAVDKQEYSLWVHSICGMACLKMILKDREQRDTKTITLAKKCMSYGGYTLHEEFEYIPPSGVIFKGFKKFLEKEWHISVKVRKYLSIKRICRELNKGNYVIASVDSAISDLEKRYRGKKGGHLVLMTGYDLPKRVLYLHNPSGIFGKSQEHFEISFEDFGKVFGERGIVVHGK